MPLAQATPCFVWDSLGHLGFELRDLRSHDELLPLDDRLEGRHDGVFDRLVLGNEVQQRDVQSSPVRNGENHESQRT